VERLEIEPRRGAGRPLVLVGLVVAALLITTLWYREGPSGPLHVTRTGLTAASEPFAVVGTWVTTPLRAVGNWVGDMGFGRSSYAQLQQQNITLKTKLAALQEAQLQNDRIRELVAFAKVQNLPSIGAQVIGRATDSQERSILIDRGSSSGVRMGDAVIAAGGLVGQVIEVAPWDSRVRLITDSASGVAVLVQRTRANGIVTGTLDGPLQLQFVDAKTPPVVGDVLITSGLGGVYPKGIVVGEVTGVSSSPTELYPSVAVASRVLIDRIEEVLVVSSETTAAATPGGGE
jgi:rod shape-determining protein MreC